MPTSNIEGRLKLRQLLLAIAITEHGSLHKAAAALNMTQPAATTALKELEATFGAPLFERSKTGMETTIYGKLVTERSRVVLANIQGMAVAINDMLEGTGGEIRIGTLPSSALGIIPEAIILSRKEHPGVQLKIVEGPTAQLISALSRGDLDLVVGRMTLEQAQGDFEYEILTAEPNVVVCRPENPLSKRSNLTLHDLADQEWIIPEEGAHFRSQWRESFREAGLVPPQAKLQTSSVTIRLALLSMTDMICVLTRRVALTMQDQGKLVILDVPIYRDVPPSIMIWRKGLIFSPAAKSFCDLLRRVTRSENAVRQ